MNRSRRKCLVLLLAGAGLLLAAGVGLAAGELTLPTWTADSGGESSQGGGYNLSGSIGQPDAGGMAGGSYRLSGGFWAGEGAGYNTIYLPSVAR